MSMLPLEELLHRCQKLLPPRFMLYGREKESDDYRFYTERSAKGRVAGVISFYSYYWLDSCRTELELHTPSGIVEVGVSIAPGRTTDILRVAHGGSSYLSLSQEERRAYLNFMTQFLERATMHNSHEGTSLLINSAWHNFVPFYLQQLRKAQIM